MKKIFLIFVAMVMLSSCEKKNAPQSAQGGTAEQIPADETVAQEPVYEFVNTLDGLNVRDRVAETVSRFWSGTSAWKSLK